MSLNPAFNNEHAMFLLKKEDECFSFRFKKNEK